MASIQVRFKDGGTAEWELHEAFDLDNLVRLLTRLTGTSEMISFVVPAEKGMSAEFGFVGLRMAEVVSWEVKGMFDSTNGAAIWDELQALSQEERATSDEGEG
jgi:hypothetical protein